jgi:threonine dehydratase
MQPLEAIPLTEVLAARNRIRDTASRTPLIRLNVDTAADIYLKLENLQPIGSFKIRGSGNVMLKQQRAVLHKGVYTASAGNMAQGVAWNARRLGIPCHVVVPEAAPQTKLDAIERLGASIIKVSYDEWWRVIVTHHFPGLDAVFIHPVSDPDVIAGNATIGLEILQDLPDVNTILVPYGGGGLSCGIASVIRAEKPDAKVYACEVETAAPFAASLERGEPVEIERTPSFIDGIGGKSVLAEMWPLASTVLSGSLVTSVDRVAGAIRTLVERNHIVAEGAGATPVAVALTGDAGIGKVVCVVSGGNIDASNLATVLRGGIPA